MTLGVKTAMRAARRAAAQRSGFDQRDVTVLAAVDDGEAAGVGVAEHEEGVVAAVEPRGRVVDRQGLDARPRTR